jgi:diguanylate cyclase (GGDEF)-like protein
MNYATKQCGLRFLSDTHLFLKPDVWGERFMNNEIQILILDDDPDDTLIISDILRETDDREYVISVAHNPASAFTCLNNSTFDVILCDYRLGATNGIDFINDMQAQNIHVPVILMTGVSDKAIDEEALRVGASDFLNKSNISSALLDKAIRYAIANAARQNLLFTVLSNVESAVCIMDGKGKPQLWNSKFQDVSSGLKDARHNDDNVDSFVADTLRSEGVLKVADKVFEKNISDLDDGRSVMTLHDVSSHIEALREREIAETKSAYLAKHCSLTGVANRLGFNEKIKQEIENGQRFQLLNLDLNKFKDVNDLFGHETGDRLLCKVTKRLKSCCQKGDYVTRIGGDEFVVIQRLADDEFQSTRLAECFQRVLEREFVINDHKLHIGVSIGISAYPDQGLTAETLLSNADIAMYRAKANTEGCIQFFDTELDNAIRERRLLIADLTEAVERKDIDVFFQPLADVKTQKILGFEALARWTHSTKGPISPDIFIELAEENGLIEKIGNIVMRKACENAVAWPYPVKVAINVSGVQIRHTDILNDVKTALFQSGLPAHRLELEVTESVLLDDFDYALHVLRGLKNMGLSLAMDDFGTGYSSLSSLISFPFDKLKIDRSFVTDLDYQQRLKNVVTTCIGLGKNLNMRMVAEGVERQAHIDFLLEQDCQEMQGFMIGRPMTNADVHDYLKFGNGHAIIDKPKRVERAARA